MTNMDGEQPVHEIESAVLQFFHRKIAAIMRIEDEHDRHEMMLAEEAKIVQQAALVIARRADGEEIDWSLMEWAHHIVLNWSISAQRYPSKKDVWRKLGHMTIEDRIAQEPKLLQDKSD